jgi:hypothetical protein
MTSWEKWPAAEAESAVMTFPRMSVGGDRPRIGLQEMSVLLLHRKRDRGVPYVLSPAMAIWRDFAEALNPPDLGRSPWSGLMERLRLPMQRFTRDFGPLFYTKRDSYPFDEGLWILSRDLLALARLWSPAAAGEPSSFLGARTVKEEHEASNIIHWLHGELTDPGDRLPSGSLLHTMLTEALRFTERRLAMHRCESCLYWFAPVRSDQRYCHANCRARAFRRAQETS